MPRRGLAGCCMILPSVRDARLITMRRGGLLSDADDQLLALWAAQCAERVLDAFEAEQPRDARPRGRDRCGPRMGPWRDEDDGSSGPGRTRDGWRTASMPRWSRCAPLPHWSGSLKRPSASHLHAPAQLGLVEESLGEALLSAACGRRRGRAQRGQRRFGGGAGRVGGRAGICAAVDVASYLAASPGAATPSTPTS